MAASEIIEGLAEFDGRGAGTDAERRAAGWLASQLRAVGSAGARRGRGGGTIRVETFWCRPNWALAAMWHTVLALAGSLVSVSSPRVGGVLVLVAILCVISDALLGVSPGRRLTPERASQNVVWTQSALAATSDPVTLVLTASLDTGRAGLLARPWFRRLSRMLRAVAGAATPGWAGWLVITMAFVEATAIARIGGARGTTVGAVQLVPTVALVLAAALLLDHGTATWSHDEDGGAGAVAAAIQIARGLAIAPPASARVRLVIQGAGHGGGIGLRRHLRHHRVELTRPRTVVVGLVTEGSGEPRYWVSDGPLVPVRCFGALRERAAALIPSPGAAVRSRGSSPALPALLRRVPTVIIGTHDPGTPPAAASAATELAAVGLLLADEIDLILAARRA